MVTEYRYVVVLADGFAYDPDRPIDKKTKRLLQTDWAQVEEYQEKVQEIERFLGELRERFIVTPNRLLAQGWVPLREIPFGYGCLLVLTRSVETSGKREGE